MPDKLLHHPPLPYLFCQKNFDFKWVKIRDLEKKSPLVGKNGKNEQLL
jgi:hypothetical protein